MLTSLWKVNGFSLSDFYGFCGILRIAKKCLGMVKPMSRIVHRWNLQVVVVNGRGHCNLLKIMILFSIEGMFESSVFEKNPRESRAGLRGGLE